MCIRDRHRTFFNSALSVESCIKIIESGYLSLLCKNAVSYTHLDVYKRQAGNRGGKICFADTVCRKSIAYHSDRCTDRLWRPWLSDMGGHLDVYKRQGHSVGFILLLIFLRLHGYRKRKTQQPCGFFAVTGT